MIKPKRLLKMKKKKNKKIRPYFSEWNEFKMWEKITSKALQLHSHSDFFDGDTKNSRLVKNKNVLIWFQTWKTQQNCGCGNMKMNILQHMSLNFGSKWSHYTCRFMLSYVENWEKNMAKKLYQEANRFLPIYWVFTYKHFKNKTTTFYKRFIYTCTNAKRGERACAQFLPESQKNIWTRRSKKTFYSRGENVQPLIITEPWYLSIWEDT